VDVILTVSLIEAAEFETTQYEMAKTNGMMKPTYGTA